MKRLILALLVGLPLAAAAQSGQYIQSETAKLLAKPKFQAETVTDLAKGTEVEVLSTEGRWVRVRHESSEGWVFKFLLGDNPPLAKVTEFSGDEKQEEDNVRRRASVVTTAGAARGLSADERRRFSSESQANYTALQRLDTFAVDREAARSFLREGLEQ